MGCTKSTMGINPTRFNKGKRARVDSPSPPRNIEPTKDKKQRYEELKTWSFILERKVILLPEEFDSFLNGLLQRNWTKLADPYRNYDPNIVLEFYTNSWVEDPNDLKAKVKGKWIYYDRNAINQFLGNPLPDNVECTYQTIKNSRDGFRERTIIEKLCILNKSFHTGSTGHSLRIKRKDMKTVAQVWMTFLLANIIPLGHVSYLNLPRCQLHYFITRDDYKVDVAQIISEHIYKTARLKINKNNEKAKGSLGFPTLITTLCASQWVAMNPTIKIRPAIDKNSLIKIVSILKKLINNHTLHIQLMLKINLLWFLQDNNLQLQSQWNTSWNISEPQQSPFNCRMPPTIRAYCTFNKAFTMVHLKVKIIHG